MIEFLLFLGVIAIVVAIIQDFYTREVANWINFSLLLFALVFRGFFSIFSENYMFLVFGLVGLAGFFVLGHLFYYGRLFAGGDAKLFIALGAVIPIADNFFENNLIFFVFVMALLFGGGVYSLAYSFFLAIKKKDSFSKEFKKNFKENIFYLYISLFLFGLFIVSAIFQYILFLFILPIFIFSIFLIYVFVKSVERSCMFVLTPVNKLSVGDWLVEEIKVRNKIIKPNWEGLSEEDLEYIKKHYKKEVLVKGGIPFTPAFLIAIGVLIYIQYFNFGNFGLYGLFG